MGKHFAIVGHSIHFKFNLPGVDGLINNADFRSFELCMDKEELVPIKIL